MTTMAFRDTHADGQSRVETRRSRSWFSSVDRRTRRWLRSAALPVALLVLFGGGVYWLLTDSARRMEETRLAAERQAEENWQAQLKQAENNDRDNLPSFAKHAARTALPDEMGKRFAVLTEAAGDAEMIAELRKLNTPATDAQSVPVLDEAAVKELERWIADLMYEHEGDMEVDSWFINNAAGFQVARGPKDTSIGQSYRRRDYFHGQGQDIPPKDPKLATIKPIQRNHLSQVYRSSTSGLLKVAFSVPIWDRVANVEGDLGEREVIGVLSMSVNVHEFKVLEKELAGGSEVVLVDLRPDYIDGEENRGLILHHPRLEKGKMARIDPELLKEIDAARTCEVENFDGKEHFQVGYVDPLAEDARQEYWGAFEPVRYKVGDITGPNRLPDRPGWLVLVQKPMPVNPALAKRGDGETPAAP